MSRRNALALVVALAALLLPARAPAGPFSRLNYGGAGGFMTGVGPQGRALGNGPFGALNVYGESVAGMQLGGEATYSSSDDVLKTRFTSLSVLARLSPVPDDYRAYVQVTAGGYFVDYTSTASVTAPASKWRPGASFGLGFDLFRMGRCAFGGVAGYHGVLGDHGAARSYMIGGLSVTVRPEGY